MLSLPAQFCQPQRRCWPPACAAVKKGAPPPVKPRPAASTDPALGEGFTFGSQHVFLVDTQAAVSAMVGVLQRSSVLAVDLEGVELGERGGKLSLIQLVTEDAPDVIFLLDVTVLGDAAFSTASVGDAPVSLRELFEDTRTELLLWDCRSDASALLHYHGVGLGAVVDLQLLEIASRLMTGRRPAFVSGLGKIVDATGHVGLGEKDKRRMAAIKAKAKALFAPESGGSYAVWEVRPLSATLIAYCCDARVFFSLRRAFASAEAAAKDAIAAETALRLASIAVLPDEAPAPEAAAEAVPLEGGAQAGEAAGDGGGGGGGESAAQLSDGYAPPPSKWVKREDRRLVEARFADAVRAAGAKLNAGRPACAAFAAGRCENGADCTFAHNA